MCMKSIYIIVLTVFFTILPEFHLLSQDINGLSIGQKMTKSQIIDKLGEPTAYRTYVAEVGSTIEIFNYDRNEVEFSDGCLSRFVIMDNRFTVLTKLISGGVKVGDPLSKINSLNPEVATWRSSSQNVYYISTNEGEINVFFVVSDGIIKNINFSIPL